MNTRQQQADQPVKQEIVDQDQPSIGDDAKGGDQVSSPDTESDETSDEGPKATDEETTEDAEKTTGAATSDSSGNSSGGKTDSERKNLRQRRHHPAPREMQVRIPNQGRRNLPIQRRISRLTLLAISSSQVKLLNCWIRTVMTIPLPSSADYSRMMILPSVTWRHP